MTREPLRHFLLVFDRDLGRLVRQDEFEDVDEAVEAYEAAEHEFDGAARIEVVLIGSDSIETVRQTHANYFDGTVAFAHAVVEAIRQFQASTEAPVDTTS